MSKFKLESKDKEIFFEADISYDDLKEMFDNGADISEIKQDVETRQGEK